jgi:hypothetical protein
MYLTSTLPRPQHTTATTMAAVPLPVLAVGSSVWRATKESYRLAAGCHPPTSSRHFYYRLTHVTAISQSAFNQAIGAGEDELGGWWAIPLVAWLAISGLVLAGCKPRLEEYR